MPYVFKEPHHPKPWRQYRWRVRNPVALPFLYIEWLGSWAAWFLGRSVLLEVLEYCGTLSILFGVILYFAGAKDRSEQKHYQAWQVINTAEGKGGNGGRIDALQDLNSDRIPLVAVDVTGGAYLRNIKLPDANMARATLTGADMRGANLRRADVEFGVLISTNLRGADLTNGNFNTADFTDADLNGANLTGADLGKAVLDQADLRNTDLYGIADWQSIGSIKLANILGCRNAPAGFREWALGAGAVEIASDDEWTEKIRLNAATQPATR